MRDIHSDFGELVIDNTADKVICFLKSFGWSVSGISKLGFVYGIRFVKENAHFFGLSCEYIDVLFQLTKGNRKNSLKRFDIAIQAKSSTPLEEKFFTEFKNFRFEKNKKGNLIIFRFLPNERSIELIENFDTEGYESDFYEEDAKFLAETMKFMPSDKFLNLVNEIKLRNVLFIEIPKKSSLDDIYNFYIAISMIFTNRISDTNIPPKEEIYNAFKQGEPQEILDCIDCLAKYGKKLWLIHAEKFNNCLLFTKN